jgi:hypothetical protein
MSEAAPVIEHVIHPASDIAISTKRRYEFAIKAIAKGIGKYIADVTTEEVIKYVCDDLKNSKKEDASLNTKRLYLSALAWNAKDDEERQKFKEQIAKIRPLADAEVESQSLSDDRKAKYMDWEDVMVCQAKAKQMYESGLMTLADYLLICLYTLQPPVRADYSEMRIVKSLNSTKKDTNYAELIGDTVFFEFQVYKTCKTYGVVTLKAHPTVAELIKKKKSESFSKICYVSSLSRSKMSERLSEIFVKCGGKPITITLLRHSYITAFYKDCPNPSIAVKKDLARKMLHSRFVQEVYNVIDLPDEESDATIEEPDDVFTYQSDLIVEPTSYSVDSTVHNRVLEEVLKLNKELLEKTTEIETLKLQIVAMNEHTIKVLEKDVQFLTALKNSK